MVLLDLIALFCLDFAELCGTEIKRKIQTENTLTIIRSRDIKLLKRDSNQQPSARTADSLDCLAMLTHMESCV